MDATLTLKQAFPSTVPADAPYVPVSRFWFDADAIRCQQVFHQFMNRLNRAVYGNAFYRHSKRLRVIPVLEKSTGERWHYHAAMEPPTHLDAFWFQHLIQTCWSRTGWGYDDIKIRAGADAGWTGYMLKLSQKDGLDHWSDCIDWGALHNPVADA
jgi:hypothetical protein